MKSNQCFVAVHVGAGYHAASKTGAYRILCEDICSEVIQLLNNGAEARKAVAHAVALLENSPLTNAGVGSNLTLEEKVECDASIMDLSGFGSVGALSNVKNPIMVALSLLDTQSNGHLSFGRIAPLMLVGEGAKIWAKEHNIKTVDDDYLKTETSIKNHRNCINKMHEIENINKNDNDKNTTKTLDTVGAIVLDSYGNFASAVSSGGILLKHPGRIGHASIYGCGCWVSDNEYSDSKNRQQIAICTTGCGEHIMKTLFAKECSDFMFSHDNDANSINEFLKLKFFNSSKLKVYNEKLIGALIGKLDFENDSKYLELFALHTTSSMCYGFMVSNMNKPMSVMSRQPEQKQKNSAMISSYRFRMDLIENFNLNNLKNDENDGNNESYCNNEERMLKKSKSND